MKNYQNSDYAANKMAEGIVYRFVNQTVEVTLEDFLKKNPDKTEEDFAELKALSDDDYYEQDRSNYRQTWKNEPFSDIEEIIDHDTLSPEDEVVMISQSQAESADDFHKKQALAIAALDKLTETQRRRYMMYHVDGLTLRQIADVEGVVHTKVHKSLLAAEKKIKKIFSGT